MSQTKYELMLQHLINENIVEAKELFHQIVVEQSQSILQDLMDESFEYDYEDDDGDDDSDEVDEGFGGDASDDFADDVGGDLNDMDDDSDDEGNDFGDDEFDNDDESSDEGAATKSDVMDIKDALAELQAEFEKMINGENDDEDEDDFGDGEDEDDFGDDEDEDNFGDGDDEDGEDGDDDEDDDLQNFQKNESKLDEYTIKVANPKGGDNGEFTRSAVASKNKMGGSASNIARSDVASSKGSSGLQSTKYKEHDAGNVNVPGGRPAGQRIKSTTKPKMGDNGSNTKHTLPRR